MGSFRNLRRRTRKFPGGPNGEQPAVVNQGADSRDGGEAFEELIMKEIEHGTTRSGYDPYSITKSPVVKHGTHVEMWKSRSVHGNEEHFRENKTFSSGSCQNLEQKRKEKRKEKKLQRKRKKAEAKANKTFCMTPQQKLKRLEKQRRKNKKRDAEAKKKFSSTCGKLTDIKKNICHEHSNRNDVKARKHIDEVNHLSGLVVAEGDKLYFEISTESLPMQITDISSKVVKEGKSKRTLGSTASKSVDGGKTLVKRKYLRRKVVEKPPALPREGAENSSIDLKVRQLPKKSCRKALNFNIKEQPRKKQTKKRLSLVTSAYGGALPLHGPPIMHNNQITLNRSSGTHTELLWRQMTSIDAIIKQPEHLDINRETEVIQNTLSYEMKNHEHNALVLYKRDGSIVPFGNPFGPMKKVGPRPKVDLDEETSQVWKLLSENINSEGIDGTDEEKAGWWAEERRVFQGHADSFIAQMHLVQGDRRFSPWKGSVVDSAVGVFLTQNASDHQSSSAFMSLASRFPQHPISEMCFDDGIAISINKPDKHILEMENPLSENSPNERVSGQSSITNNEYEKNQTKELLDMAGSDVPPEVSVHENEDVSLNEYTETVINRSSELNDGEETLQTDSSCTRSTLSFTCCLGLPEVECPKRLLQETYFSESSETENEQIIKYEAATRFSITDSKMTGICEELCEHSIKNNQPCNSCIGGENSEDRPAVDHEIECSKAACQGETSKVQTVVYFSELLGEKESTGTRDVSKGADQESADTHPTKYGLSLTDDSNKMNITNSKRKSGGFGKEKKEDFDWDSLRRHAESNGRKRVRMPNTMDSVDWEAVRRADVNEIADAIKERGMNNVLAGRIKDFLNRLVREHGSVDLEWLRDVPSDKAKEYLLSMRGLGLKSVECVRLLTLHHCAFPVDTNVGRIAVRLGWVPLQPLPESLQFHPLELYPSSDSIQRYLWTRLCKLDQRTLYELHYQMITFGKVFCTKDKPNCNACPMRGECRHFASAFASARLVLPRPEEKSIVNAMRRNIASQNIGETLPLSLPLAKENLEEPQQEARPRANNCQPIIEEPVTLEPDCTLIPEIDMEDMFSDDFNEIPKIKLNMEEFTQNLQKQMQHNMDLQENDMSKALVALTPEAASIPVPKLKNVSRLRTEHLAYEIPEGHPLMNGLDKLEEDDQSKYLLVIWTPGEMASSVQPPEHGCNSQEFGTLCNEKSCILCNSIKEANSQTVRGTFLIPCRTAMRGSFPLNGTYFQVNEVFADHESSVNPIDVPRSLLWNLQRRLVYFGTSIPTIFKGMSANGIQRCFWRGFVCVRGFDRKTRAPRPLMARLHFPASKLPKTKGKHKIAISSEGLEGVEISVLKRHKHED